MGIKHSYRILLVDDNASFLKALKLQITDIMSVQIESIDTAANGKEAIEMIARKKHHIVFMDLDMPVLNGVEATMYIHKHYPAVVIVALSMYNDLRSIETITLAGAHTYLVKDNLDEGSIKRVFDISEVKPIY
jgi:YesN/AraC family two-component response regulator